MKLVKVRLQPGGRAADVLRLVFLQKAISSQETLADYNQATLVVTIEPAPKAESVSTLLRLVASALDDEPPEENDAFMAWVEECVDNKPSDERLKVIDQQIDVERKRHGFTSRVLLLQRMRKHYE